MSATRKPAPYPEHDCPNCERGERVTVPPYSSIVGQMGVHPQGNICRKWMSPEVLNAHAVFQSGAPLQPGATQPEHEVVAHKLPALGLCERTFTHSELTTLLERMARLVVQEAAEMCRKEDAWYLAMMIQEILTKAKLQQLREAVERP